MPLTRLSGTLSRKQAAHLLRRATFGATKDDITAFEGLDVQQAVARLFDAALPDPEPPVDPEIAGEWINSGLDGDENARQDYFKWWLIGQALIPSRVPVAQKFSYSLREKITFFLHTYFTAKISTVDSSRALYFQNALFRMFAFDQFFAENLASTPETAEFTANFKELTKKVCVDNAMLIFLDGDQNVKGNVNENFAREMFELYTIGRGLESENATRTPRNSEDYFFFTEEDIREASKVLSGWDNDQDFANIDEMTGLPRGVMKGGATNATQHDEGDKTFSDYHNDQVISPDPLLLMNGNQTEESALDEISRMIEMIFENEETSKHLCRKLYRFFVHYEVTTDIENNIVQAMADTFVANDYQLQPVLVALFESQHFYDAAGGTADDKFGGIIKSPFDLVAGTYTTLQIAIPDYAEDAQNFYDLMGSLTGAMNDMGMDFYEPFEVAGYGAYHQYPRFNRNWISTHWLTQRYNFIRQLFAAEMNDTLVINPLVFIQNNYETSAGDARQLIIDLATLFFPMAENLDFDVDGGDLTPARMRHFLQVFLGFDDYATEANMAVANWSTFYANENNYLEVTVQFTRLLNAMLQSPEYQLF